VIIYGSHSGKDSNAFGLAYDYVEKIQITAFTIQKLILSVLYIWKALDVLRTDQKKYVIDY
jgi:hypothetical protein